MFVAPLMPCSPAIIFAGLEPMGPKLSKSRYLANIKL